MKGFFLLIAAFLLSSCVSSGIIPVGSERFSPFPAGTPVLIYSSEKEVESTFKVIGLISYTNAGKYQILSLSDVIEDLKEQARGAGANGIIIDETHVVKSGIISTGIGVGGRAIRIGQ